MDVEPPTTAAPVPGAMTQPEVQSPKPMELDGGDGSALTQEEQEQWDRSELTRAAEIGREMAEKLTAAKEEAAAKGAPKGTGSPGKARTPSLERIARRALARSPYKKQENEEEDLPPLETVSEEADAKKVPSDGEGEQGEEAEAEEDLDPPEDRTPEEE
jgi:hypothetical protein